MSWAKDKLRPVGFDRWVLAVLLGLATVIGLTLLRGDQIGVRLIRYGPIEEARRSAVVTVQFSEDIKRETVAAHFRIDPQLKGELTWSGRTLVFRPTEELEIGTRYTVEVDAGIQSEAGRSLLASQSFGFTVHGSRVAYLAPVDAAVKNVWIADPQEPARARQLTHSPFGVLGFDASPDGASLVFAERNAAHGADLKALDLDQGQVSALTICGENECTSPAWSPDGRWIAFDRQASTPSAIPGFARDATRVWLLDMSSLPPEPRPLFEDPQIPTHNQARWSPDGSRIAVDQPVPASAGASTGVLIYDLRQNQTRFLRASGPGGIFVEEGAAFVLPDLQPREGRMYQVARLADLVTLEATELPVGTDVSPPVHLATGPSNGDLTMALPSVGDRGAGRQVYVSDLRSGSEPLPLFVELGFAHSGLSWDPTRRYLAMERAAVQNPSGSTAPFDARYQVAVYDMQARASIPIAMGAYRPRWVS